MAQRRSTAVAVRTGPKASEIAKSARYEAAIAKAEKDLADRQAAIAKAQKDLADRQAKLVATRAEYEAYMAATGARLTPEQKEAALGPKPQKGGHGPMPPLIRTPGVGRQSPLQVLDPYELALDYGPDQLRNVLSRATQKNLKVAVGLVGERHRGTKPANSSTNAGLIDYIVQYVAPGY